jgi:hypothetical protein
LYAACTNCCLPNLKFDPRNLTLISLHRVIWPPIHSLFFPARECPQEHGGRMTSSLILFPLRFMAGLYQLSGVVYDQKRANAPGLDTRIVSKIQELAANFNPQTFRELPPKLP